MNVPAWALHPPAFLPVFPPEPPRRHKLSYVALFFFFFLSEASINEINKIATAHWLEHARAGASVSISTRPQHRALRIPGNMQFVPHWRTAYWLSGHICSLLLFCFFRHFSVISSCLFFLNQSPANTLIPGCFPAVQEVRSPHCSQQTGVGFLWKNQTQLVDSSTGWNCGFAAVCICFRKTDSFFF